MKIGLANLEDLNQVEEEEEEEDILVDDDAEDENIDLELTKNQVEPEILVTQRARYVVVKKSTADKGKGKMKEVMKNCITRKTAGSTSIRINESNQLLRKPVTEPTTANPSQYKMPHQMMITPSIPQKIHHLQFENSIESLRKVYICGGRA